MEPGADGTLNRAIDAFFKALPTESEWRRLQRIADQLTPQLRKQWLKMLAATVEGINERELARLLRADDTAGIIALVRNSVQTVGAAELSAGFLVTVQQIYSEAGRAAVRLLPVKEKLPFAVVSDDAMNFLRQYAGELITNTEVRVLETVQEMLDQIHREGIPLRRAMDMIRSTEIGLTRPWERAIRNMERALREQGVSEGRIAQLLAQRRNALLNARASMIVSTEANRAANEGHRAAIRQAVADGRLDPAKWVNAWSAQIDDATCQVCLDAHGTTKELLAELYPNGLVPGGGLRGPHPNCRCGEVEVRRPSFA